MMNLITSQTNGLYMNITGQPKSLSNKRVFNGTFAREARQVAPDNQGIRVELFILPCLT